jgi:hypothetical protein
VTFSQDWYLRNVTLAQDEHHLIFQVRTPWSGSNGSSPEFVLPDAVQTGIPTWAVATFVYGVVTMKTQSEAGMASATFRPDLLRSSIQLRNGSLSVIWHGRAALVGIIVFFVALGLAVGWLLQTRLAAAALIGPAVAAVCLWAVDIWVLGTLPPGAFELTFTTRDGALWAGLSRLAPGTASKGFIEVKDDTAA